MGKYIPNAKQSQSLLTHLLDSFVYLALWGTWDMRVITGNFCHIFLGI